MFDLALLYPSTKHKNPKKNYKLKAKETLAKGFGDFGK
jgi:hypothetical protein